jgi:dihydropteroate synthase
MNNPGMDKDTLFYKKHTIACGNKLLSIEDPVVMGILNVTPDSFYDGGNYLSKESLLKKAKQIINEGAEILDIGGYSSRPGAEDINQDTEFERLTFALDIIRENFPEQIISVDTFRSSIAEQVIEKYKVNIINDISGGESDPEIIDVAASKNVPYICMHMQGNPQNMQEKPTYSHVVKDLLNYFTKKVYEIRNKGVKDIIVDPGFGFGKTLDQNYQLLLGLDVFEMLEVPVLVGLSRKSMIYKLLNTTPEEALTGTTALNLIALQNGASILRVHDISETKQTISIYKKLLEESEKSFNLLEKL